MSAHDDYLDSDSFANEPSGPLLNTRDLIEFIREHRNGCDEFNEVVEKAARLIENWMDEDRSNP